MQTQNQAGKERTGAQIIVESLLEQGVDTVFGYPGGNILHVYDELYRRRESIRHILPAHEQGACHAADGYARSTGRPGVVIATSGPGAANLITGIATAYMDSVPLVILTGNVPTPWRGRDSFQEVDMMLLSMSVTKHNFYITDADQLADTIRLAFEIAMEGRPGPVLIDIPRDIQDALSAAPPAGRWRTVHSGGMTDAQLDQALRLMSRAKHPFVYAGGGVLKSGAAEELRQLAALLDAPVACSLMGLGAMPYADERFTGMVGMHGTPASNYGISRCDLLVVLGARFSDRVISRLNGFARRARIVQIDIDPAEMNKNIPAHTMIYADLKEALESINARLPRQSHESWCRQVKSYGREVPPNSAQGILPGALIRAVARLAGGDAYVATDVGQHQMWTAQYYPISKPLHFLTSGGLGTMGFGLGAAIGAQIAHPGQTVVLFTGDGSFRMNLNELATVARYALPIKIILLNNASLGMIRQWQELFYENRYAESSLTPLDYCTIARGFGIAAQRLTAGEDWQQQLENAFAQPGAVLIECPIAPDSKVLPMVMPGKGLESMELSSHEL